MKSPQCFLHTASRAVLRPLLFGAVSLFVAVPALLQAANPPTGTISATSTTPVTWVGTATGGAAPDEPTAIEGINKDVFKLTVLGTPADFAGKTIPITFTWMLPSNDYDVVLRKDDGDGVYETTNDDVIVGTSGNGAPETREAVAIKPSDLNASGTTTFWAVAVYFAVPPPVLDQYNARAEVVTSTSTRTATYQPANITFSPNTALKAPVAARDGEPSSRIDKLGNYFVGGIRGVPAGIDLWYFDLKPNSPTYDPLMRNPLYRGQPDAFTAAEGAAADGGGDIDLAIGVDAQGNPVLAFSSLVAANISTGKSTDLGASFQLNPAGNATGGPPGDDRQWHEFAGPNTVYMLYRTLAPAFAQIQRSNDGGLTYGATTVVGSIGQVGCLDVDQFDGTVVASGGNGVVAIGTPPPGNVLPPPTYTIVSAIPPEVSDAANIFFVTKVADDNRDASGALIGPGTIYVCYSDGKDIFVAHSTSRRDGASSVTFSSPVKVNSPDTATNLLPWIETGPTPGTIGVVWYGSTSPTNSNSAQWKVYYSLCYNASDASPTFFQAAASDHFIHGSNISLGGLDATGMGANRNLIDYFQLVFDPTGAAVIGFTDDHNDYDGHTYVTRQISGPSINAELPGAAANVPTPAEGSGLAAAIQSNIAGTLPGTRAPLLVQPGPNGEQVMDFALDAESGINTTVNAVSPVDILSVKYITQDTPGGRILTATMTVSGLDTIPNNASWRMSFTANAPDSTDNGPAGTVGKYSNGVSDQGDQFFMIVRTNASGTRSAAYGSAVRNSNGSLTYTDIGPADRFTINRGNRTITVSVALSKINAALTAAGRPVIREDGTSFLTGLRGRAATADTDDLTRGGTSLRVGLALPGATVKEGAR